MNQGNGLTSLTLQDTGQLLPGALIVIIRCEGSPVICKTDEVGEIAVSSTAAGSSYWGPGPVWPHFFFLKFNSTSKQYLIKYICTFYITSMSTCFFSIHTTNISYYICKFSILIFYLTPLLQGHQWRDPDKPHLPHLRTVREPPSPSLALGNL